MDGLGATRSKSVIPVIPLMHIRGDQLHASGVGGCKDMPAQQFFIFSQLTLLQNCPAIMPARRPLRALQHAGPGSVQMPGTIPSGKSR